MEAITLVCVLKACADVQDINKGQELHFEIVKYGFLSKDTILGNALVDMYAKCGFLAKAQDVFHKLPMRNVVSWNVLITGYVQHGDAEEALSCFQKMQVEDTSPNDVTFLSILKACGLLGAFEKGQEIHAQIRKGGLLRENNGVGSALVDMYVKCGLLERAQAVFDELPHWDVVSWTSLIAGYAEHGHCDEALKCFQWLELKGLFLDLVTFVCMLKVCASIGLANKGQELHTKIVREGVLDKDTVVGTALVDMYAICGMLLDAQKVFEKLPIRDVAAWNALIAGFIQYGFSEEAMNCFENMRQLAYSPDVTTFACILKACGSTGNVQKGEEMHVEISRQGSLGKDTIVGTALVDMYAKCGMLAKAQQVLEALPARNAVTWNTLIAGYAQHNQGKEALDSFDSMQREGFFPNDVTFTCILKACGSIGAIDKGKQIHDEIASKGLLEKNVLLSTSLVDMYAKCGVLAKAHEVLEALPFRDTVCWSALISGYAQDGHGDQALNYFGHMQREGLIPNDVTYICILKACGSIGAIANGKKLHAEILQKSMVENSVMLGNGLVDMYAKCGLLDNAQNVLEELPVRNVISWSALIAGYAQAGQGNEAIDCFDRMRWEGISPNEVTFVCILKACGNVGAIEKGKQIHDEIIERDLLEKHVALSNALVDMYAKCGMLSEAERVLEEIPDRSVVSWSALIAGYIQAGQCHEALNCFKQMQREVVSPNEVTFACILKACATTGSMDKGKQIHNEIVNRGLLKKTTTILGNSLVDMYVKFGMYAKAQLVLDALPVRDVVSWSTLIAGYAQQGKGCEALKCFNSMQMEGFSPDEIMFLCMLNACGHSGLMYEAEMLFANMLQKYNVAPNFEHYACMVLIFGCGGNFEKAMSVITAMPSRNPCAVWLSLLSTSRKWGNVKLARLAFNQVVRLDKSCTAAYALMANTLADNDMQENAENIESTRLA